MSDERTRWRVEAAALVAAWTSADDDRAPMRVRIDREGERSCLRIAYADPRSGPREEIEPVWPPSGARATGTEQSEALWWHRVQDATRGAGVTEGERRGYEAAAASVLWIERRDEGLVEDRVTSDFSLERRNRDSYVTFVDDWAGQRERIEFPVWLERHGGVDAEALGNFWLGLAEGTVTGTPV